MFILFYPLANIPTLQRPKLLRDYLPNKHDVL